MRILLDTHIYLWWVKEDRKLSKAARTLIHSADEVFISSASIWEISIKVKLKKLSADPNDLVAAIEQSGFLELPITTQHAAKVYELKDIHRDHFDRMLLAQAMSEPLRLVTGDAILQKYSDLVELI